MRRHNGTVQTSKADGTRLGVPFHVGATVMYWNADLLESYGLDYKSVKTWDDYTKLGEELKEASNGEVYLTSVDTGGVDWMWLAMAETVKIGQAVRMEL